MGSSRLPGRLSLHIFASAGAVTIAVAAFLVPASRPAAEPPGVHAIVNARVITAPGQAIANGTIVIRDGLIESVGANIEPPADAAVMDANGMTVTAGFIDGCSRIAPNGPPRSCTVAPAATTVSTAPGTWSPAGSESRKRARESDASASNVSQSVGS